MLERSDLALLLSDALCFDLDLRTDLGDHLAELADLLFQLLELATLLQLLVSLCVDRLHLLLRLLDLLLESALVLLPSADLVFRGGDFLVFRCRPLPGVHPLPGTKRAADALQLRARLLPLDILPLLLLEARDLRRGLLLEQILEVLNFLFLLGDVAVRFGFALFKHASPSRLLNHTKDFRRTHVEHLSWVP